MTRLSILVPSPIRDVSKVARSIVQFDPISTSFSTSSRPVCGTFTWRPSTWRYPNPSPPEHAAGVHLDPIAQDDVGIEHGVGVDDAVPAQPASISDDRARVQRRSIAHNRAIAHIGERIDRHVLTDLRRRGDPGLGMNPGPSRRDPAVQVGAHRQERRHRVIDFDDGQASCRHPAGRD